MTLEDQAKAAVAAEEAKAKGWLAVHRATIITGAVCFVLGVIVKALV